MEYISDKFNYSVIALEAQYPEDITIESLSDIFESIGDAFTNVVNFFKDVVKNGFADVLDDIIFNTKIVKELYQFERRGLPLIKSQKFIDIADKQVTVAPGLAYRVNNISEFIDKNFKTLVESFKDLDHFEKQIADFITHPDHRSELISTKPYKDMETKQVKLQNELDLLLDPNQKTISTIKDLYGNMDGIDKTLKHSINILKTYQEKDVKKWVASVRNLDNRLNVLLEIIQSDGSDIPEENIKAMAYIVNILANQMTLLGKFYSLSYDIGLVLIRTNETLTGSNDKK